MKIFLESCKETSKLSGDVFWGRWDHIVAQKSIFKIFFFEKQRNSCNPPLVSYLRDIEGNRKTHVKKEQNRRFSALFEGGG